jgi:hypothetical protein
MKKLMLCAAGAFLFFAGRSQLVIEAGSTVVLESGAKLVVQGNLSSASPISGTGTVVMKGTAAQTLAMNGNTIPNLEIDNPANVSLDGSGARIGSSLLFTNGKLLTAAQDLILAPAATISGQSASRFIWTSGAGQVKKELTADIANTEIPVGENASYRPVYLTAVGGTYAAGATIGVRNASGISSNRPPSVANFIGSYWSVSKNGITGGTQTMAAQYLDPADVTGNEENLRGYFFDGSDWTSVNGTNDAATNRISARIAAASGEITALNKFLAVGARAFLQGAYNSSLGRMNDGLRSGTNVIPATDPYGTAPYTGFTDVNNPIAEVAAPSVFADQSGITSVNDNIIDWVFLELRNTTSPGNAVLQTRSALVQSDGDIVDVDGKSPVTFNNVLDGNYTIAVRHRNHLGLATLPSSPHTFAEKQSLSFAANVVDLRAAGTALFGTSGSTYAIGSHPTLATVQLLMGGNGNHNTNVRYTGLSNDKDFILVTTLGNNPANVMSNVYHPADLNMNKNVRYTGLNNDKDFLLVNVLQSTPSTIRNQALPN